MAMIEHLSYFSKILEEFFKGLSECGLMSNYIIQLQSIVCDINLEVISKFRCLIEQAIKQLQNLLSSTAETESMPENPQPLCEAEVVNCASSSITDLTDSRLNQLSPLRWNAVKYDLVDRNSFKEIILHKQRNISVLKPFILAKRENFSKLHCVKELNVDNVVQIIVEASDVEPNSSCIIGDAGNILLLETSEDELKCANNGCMKTEAERKDPCKISDGLQSIQLENSQTCDICNKEFTCLVSLQEHFRHDHAGVGCFLCQTCGKRLTTKMSLARHQATHGGGQPALCKFCGKAFSRADYLQTHYASHIGKRKFACPHCPSKFNCNAHLKVHEKIHTGVKEHICNECGKGFGRKDKLKEHVLRHLKVKRFPCHVCQKQYAEARDLKKHLRSHAPPVP